MILYFNLIEMLKEKPENMKNLEFRFFKTSSLNYNI